MTSSTVTDDCILKWPGISTWRLSSKAEFGILGDGDQRPAIWGGAIEATATREL